jgi:hypothetical protein
MDGTDGDGFVKDYSPNNWGNIGITNGCFRTNERHFAEGSVELCSNSSSYIQYCGYLLPFGTTGKSWVNEGWFRASDKCCFTIAKSDTNCLVVSEGDTPTFCWYNDGSGASSWVVNQAVKDCLPEFDQTKWNHYMYAMCLTSTCNWDVRVWVNGCMIINDNVTGKCAGISNACIANAGPSSVYMGQFRRYCADTNTSGWIGNANCTTGFNPYPGMIPVQTATPTISVSPTQGSSPTPTLSNTPTSTNTPTQQATRTITPTNTRTATQTVTQTRTSTNTKTPTYTPTNTATNTPTRTGTPTQTKTQTSTPNNTPTSTITTTPTYTSTKTNTPTYTSTVTKSKTYTNTHSNTATSGITNTKTQTRTSTTTPTYTATRTASAPISNCLAINFDVSDSRSYTMSAEYIVPENVYNLVDGSSAAVVGVPGYNNFRSYQQNLRFDNGDYICYNNDSYRFNPENGFTVTMWLRPTCVGMYSRIATQWDSECAWRLMTDNNCGLMLCIYNCSDNQLGSCTSVKALSSTNDLVYIAATYNSDTGTTTFYRNGTCIDSGTTSCTNKVPKKSLCPVVIANQASGSFANPGCFNFFKGKMYNCVLSDSEITNDYNNSAYRFSSDVLSTPTPSVTKGASIPTSDLELYVNTTSTLSYPSSGGNTIYDMSGNGIDGTLSGPELQDFTSSAKNLYFNGSDAITFSNSAISGDWTYTVVAKVDNFSLDQYILEFNTTNGGLATIANYADQHYNLYSQSYPVDNNEFDSRMGINYGKYDVITWVRKDDVLRGYINGVKEVEVTINTNSTYFQPTGGLRIGSAYNGNSDFTGNFGAFLLYSRALSQGEVRSMASYLNGTFNFDSIPASTPTPTPTVTQKEEGNWEDNTSNNNDLIFSPLGGLSQVITDFEGASGSTTFTNYASGGITLTATGDVYKSTAIKKFGNSSMYMPTNASALTISDNLDFGTQDFGVQFWYYKTNGSQTAGTIIGGTNQTAGNLHG